MKTYEWEFLLDKCVDKVFQLPLKCRPKDGPK
jgi:hypothetical protein